MKERNIFERILTDDCPDEELCKYLLQAYFSKGYGLSDFEDDLIFGHGRTEEEAKRITENVKLIIRNL